MPDGECQGLIRMGVCLEGIGPECGRLFVGKKTGKHSHRKSYEPDGGYRYPGLERCVRSPVRDYLGGQWWCRGCDGYQDHVVPETSRVHDVIDNAVVGNWKCHGHGFWT